MTTVKKNMNVDIKRWKIWSRFLFVFQAILVCVYGGLSMVNFWNSENVDCVQAKEIGKLVLLTGALHLLGVVFTCVRWNRHNVKFMLAVYVILSACVMSLYAYHLAKINELTQTWTDIVTISTVLMSLYVILMIVQCVVFVVIINKLPKEETYDSIPIQTNVI